MTETIFEVLRKRQKEPYFQDIKTLIPNQCIYMCGECWNRCMWDNYFDDHCARACALVHEFYQSYFEATPLVTCHRIISDMFL